MPTYYALTASGLDKVEAGLVEKGVMDATLGALIDLEETQPDRPHTLDELIQMSENAATQKGLDEAIRRGYAEQIQPGDERFSNF